MLTNDDLKKIKALFDPQFGQIDKRFNQIDQRLEKLEKEQGKQGRTLREVKNTLNVAINAFNREDVLLKKRMDRVEGHLSLPKLNPS